MISPAPLNITYRILCRAGVLLRGGTPDFLLSIMLALESKAIWSQKLPGSTLRVQFFYSNGQRVPKSELSAALRALANPIVSAAVARRRATAAQNSPARSEARTAEFLAASGPGFAVAVDVAFSQAGVVAPPDSPDLGNFSISQISGLGI